MIISDVIQLLEETAPLNLQEDYDNCGLITGSPFWTVTGVLVTLDVTEATIDEAISKQMNLVVAHHPVIFKGLKKITPSGYTGRTLIKAIKNDIAIYAIHTNLDNLLHGVNGKIADKLALVNRSVLTPKGGKLLKLAVFVPVADAENLKIALFAAGAGNIGDYSECSFETEGSGSYKPGKNSNPYRGDIGTRHTEREIRLEVIFPEWEQQKVLKAMSESHPYEEVAYDLYSLRNEYQKIGSGLIGSLGEACSAETLLTKLKAAFGTPCIKYSGNLHGTIQRIALCGGAGSFLIKAAIASGADAYVTSDIKYHEFFEAENKLLLVDIGHYESEAFTEELLVEILRKKFPNFAVLKTSINTNPVHYFI